MKRPSREFNIFSMSALDLFASAMGAFILLTVILFPYYQKNAKIVEDLNKTKNQLAQTQQQLQQCEQQRQICEEKLRKTFLAVVMKWATNQQDIDLHVIDTQGREFYYQQKRFIGSNAELSVDTTRGPGIEIWEHPQAEPGEYKVYVNLFARNDNAENPRILTTVYYRDGAKKLPDLILSTEQQKKLVAIIQVNSDGDVVIQNN